MNQAHDKPLRIWQQNLNKSARAQHDLLNDSSIADYDILALQEPHLNFLGLSVSTAGWRAVYPSVHGVDGAGRVRSLILVNKRLSTNSWNPVSIPHADVSAVTIRAAGSSLHIVNLYVGGEEDAAIHASSRAVQAFTSIQDGGAHHLVWLGDFNRHHPAWDDPGNHHLFTTAALQRSETLINVLDRHDLLQALPPGIPTLEASRTKNFTRPDNVFCTPGVLERLRTCTVIPERRPTKTDHFPIQTMFDIPTVAAPDRRRKDFRQVDWEQFEQALADRIVARNFPAHIRSVRRFDTVLDQLMDDLQATIAEQVPDTAETPYAKRWWSAELTKMRKEKERLSRLSHRHKADTRHPAHAEYHRFRNKYADHITAAKNDFWKAWIDSVNSKTIWDANRFLKRGTTDGSSARIPPIRVTGADGQERSLNANAEKGAEFHRTFFLPPSTAPIPTGPYPRPRYQFQPITDTQIRRAIAALRAFKAPGPDAIPNEVYKHCVGTLTPVLGSLFRASFALKYYPDRWKVSDTVVLQKPGKADYTVAKAWRPIALLDCMSKILSRCVADVLVYEAEQKSMLANLQFGGRAGRTTTDSIHLVTKRVKDAQRRNHVASVVFLDIKSAFPAASPERLYHNLRSRGVPVEYVDWLRVKLSGARHASSLTTSPPTFSTSPAALTRGAPSRSFCMRSTTPTSSTVQTWQAESARSDLWMTWRSLSLARLSTSVMSESDASWTVRAVHWTGHGRTTQLSPSKSSACSTASRSPSVSASGHPFISLMALLLPLLITIAS